MAVNRMLVMVPLMLAARKLDAEDLKTVAILRASYSVVQVAIVICVIIFLIKSHQLKDTKEGQKVVYSPAAAQPLAGLDPNAKKKYTETTFGAMLYSSATSLAASTFFGILLTVGLHFYRGIVMGLSMQCIMGPLTLYESPLTKFFFFGETKSFNEKSKEELTPEDEVVDSEGNPVKLEKKEEPMKEDTVVRTVEPPEIDSTCASEIDKKFEDQLLDVWDRGSDADVTPLVEALTKSNVNYRTSENMWSPLMILCGLSIDETREVISQMITLGADAELVDGEGWNALHWAAFHGNLKALDMLLSEGDDGFDGVKLGLHLVKDKDGKIPLDLARAEENYEVADILEKLEYVVDHEYKEQDEGIRKRK